MLSYQEKDGNVVVREGLARGNSRSRRDSARIGRDRLTIRSKSAQVLVVGHIPITRFTGVGPRALSKSLFCEGVEQDQRGGGWRFGPSLWYLAGTPSVREVRNYFTGEDSLASNKAGAFHL